MHGASLGIFSVPVQRPRTIEFHPNRINPTELWRHIDGGRDMAILLSISFLVTSLNEEGRYLHAYQILVTFLITLLRYYYFRFLKTSVRHVGILLPVSIFTFHHRPVIVHLLTKFRPNGTVRGGVMTSYPFFQDGGHGITILLPVLFFVTSLIWEKRNIPADQISARDLNPRLTYYYFRFLKTNVRRVRILLPVSVGFRLCIIIGMSFCICLPNFVEIEPSAMELWCHIHFPRWGPRHRNSISGFVFRDFAHLVRSKSTRRPNFGEISQSTAEILLLLVSENKRPPCWNSTSGFDFHPCIIISMSFCICLSDFIQIWPPTKCKWGSQLGPQISTSGFIVLEILLFLCCEILAWNCLFTWLYPQRMRTIRG